MDPKKRSSDKAAQAYLDRKRKNEFSTKQEVSIVDPHSELLARALELQKQQETEDNL